MVLHVCLVLREFVITVFSFRAEQTDRCSLEGTKEISLLQMLQEYSKHIDIDRNVTDEMIDKLLDRSELYQIMMERENERKAKKGRTYKSPRL